MNKRHTFFTLGMLLIFSTFLFGQELTPLEQLGKKIFFDKISSPDWMSCATCHAPEVGFTGPIPGVNRRGSVYFGAVPQRFGNRKPPSAAYATLSPILTYDSAEELFIGGNFWDGRATGEHLGNPAADQALGPFLNPVEQNNASKQAVLEQIAGSKYSELWEAVWGEPISYSSPADIDVNYDRVGLSIAAYENSMEVNSFTSKFDYYLQGEVELTPQEELGMGLFNGAAMCSQCHISDPGLGGEPPLFTDFTYDNLGTPKNPENPFYNMDLVYLDDGAPINPAGDAWLDKGLGGFLENHSNPAWQALSSVNMGKHKVPTLRNVDKRPSNGFAKAYLHNGVFKSLKEVVHFYNTRDVGSWPPPEIPENVNDTELGDLGLSEDEEDAIVAFMKTLSDGFRIDKLKKESSTLSNVKEITTLKIVGPNPFNPSTKLSYFIPEDSDIKLEVFNITGQKVATLQNNFMSAGEHQVDFNASHLATGIYIVNLLTNNEMKTVKLILMK